MVSERRSVISIPKLSQPISVWKMPAVAQAAPEAEIHNCTTVDELLGTFRCIEHISGKVERIFISLYQSITVGLHIHCTGVLRHGLAVPFVIKET
jgi:hypothetical protein